MDNKTLQGKKIAIIATDGVDSIELGAVRSMLTKAGAITTLISIDQKTITTTQENEVVPVDTLIEQTTPQEFDALFLPGGLKNSDKLRTYPQVIHFIEAIASEDKPIAAICHAPWLLIDAGVAKGKRITSYPSLRVDLQNAGAEWVNEQVVVDGKLITSRRPDDVEAFGKTLIQFLSKE